MSKIIVDDVPIFNNLPEEEKAFVADLLGEVELEDGEILFKEKEYADCFYIIDKGALEVWRSMDTPNEQLISLATPGTFLGEMSVLMTDRIRTASVRARGKSHLYRLFLDDFEELLERSPMLANTILKGVGERLLTSNNDISEKNVELVKAYDELKAAQDELVEKEKLEHEMNMARNIQISILPKNIQAPEGFDFGARMVPARAVGGDFYEFHILDENTLGIAIGDVSDKGVPAALFMAQFCTLLRVESQRGEAPEEVLTLINNNLLEMNHSGLFVTAIYGRFDTRTHSYTYARAGHEVPVLFDADGKISQPERGNGMALCLFPNPPLDVQTIEIPPGSMMLLYTDGGTDAQNNEMDFFGLENLEATIANYLDLPAQEIVDKVVDELVEYQVEDGQFDDITLAILRSL